MPTIEYQALRRLSAAAARLNKEDRTMPVLMWLNWGGLIFVVMPRYVFALPGILPELS